MRSWHASVVRFSPLLMREIRKPARYSASRIFFTTLAIGILSIIVGLVAMLMRREIGALRFVLAAWVLIVVAIPPFLATATAQVTFEEMLPERFDPLYITPLSDAQLALGLLLSILYKFRNWLLVAAASTTILLLLSTYVLTYEGLVRCWLLNSSWTVCADTLPNGPETLVAFLHVITLLINLWLMMLFAALLGMALTLWWRQRYFANYGAALGIAILDGFAIVSIMSNTPSAGFYNNIFLVWALAILIILTYLVASAHVRTSL